MVPMRDGVRLASDIYRPMIDGEIVSGPLPTILGRTSYDKTNMFMWIKPVADYFTPRGYAVVLQDLRGRYQSEGTGQYFHVANPLDGQDGYDTIEWLAAQTVVERQCRHGGVLARRDDPDDRRAGKPAASQGDLAGCRPDQQLQAPHARRRRHGAAHVRGAVPACLRGAGAGERPGRQARLRAGDGRSARLGLAHPVQAGPHAARQGARARADPFQLLHPRQYDEWWHAKFNDYEASSTSTPIAPGRFPAAGTTPTRWRPPSISAPWRARTPNRNG